MISNIAPEAPFPVYDKSYWFSDNWDALSYGRSFDFSKSFAENFRALQVEVPRFSIQQQEPMENSLYCNYASNCQNSYFLFDSDYCRDSYYSYVVKRCRDCCDCDFTTDSELCYETVNCKNCYNLRYSQNCQNCTDSVFLDSCIGCRSCAFSANLRNKEFYFRNRQLSEAEYNEEVSRLKLDRRSSIAPLASEFREYLKRYPRKFCQGASNEDVSGDYIFNSKKVVHSFNVEEVWDVAYCDNLYRARNCMDVSSFGEQVDWIYETATAGLNTQQCAFCFTAVVSSQNLLYCDTAYASRNCFGCVGIHRKEHCILNRQYSRDEYEALAVRIVEHMRETGEWGEFFPVSTSPFAYNETVADQYFPLSEDEARTLHYRWRPIESCEYRPATGSAPDSVAEAVEGITAELLACERCRKNYKITKQEFGLYRKQQIPLPNLCFDCRQRERMERRQPREIFNRSCDRCGLVMSTTYSPQAPYRVYCEECFLKSVN